jgi:predicted esterase
MIRNGTMRNRFLRLGRRSALLGAAASVLAARSHAARADRLPGHQEDLRNLRLLDLSEAGRRFVLLLPRYQQPGQRVPLLVLLHGLGETGDPRLGAHAWLERYGAGSAWQRLKRPPIAPLGTRGDWTPARLAEVNDELRARPFRGFAMACPHMPNLSGSAALDAYASWLTESLVPRVRREAQVHEDAARTYLCGVSLGGYVSLEVVTRTRGVFGAWGGVQTAIGAGAASRYAERLARDGSPSSLFLLTSSKDPFRKPTEALAAALEAKGLPATYRMIPGPHDQPWLRDAGTIETLLWFDRLAYAPPP